MIRDVIEARYWKPAMGIRYCFTYMRSRIVPARDGKPAIGLPFCYKVAWRKLDRPDQVRLYYIRCDWKGDGLRARLIQRRGHHEEQIVCARRLTALPPKRLRHWPSYDQEQFAAKYVRESLDRWTLWAAEHRPTTLLRHRWHEFRRRLFGITKHVRQIVLASEVAHYERGYNGPLYQPVHWLVPEAASYSYLRWRWHWPSTLNQIRSHDLWHSLGRKELIVGYVPVRPDLQAELYQTCQRILIVDYSDPDIWQDWGNVPLHNYRGCIVPDTILPGAEFETFDESKMKDRAPDTTRKREFLKGIGAWPTD